MKGVNNSPNQEDRLTEQARLSAIVYGESGSGKSTISGTAPQPVVIFEAEAGGSKWVKSFRKKIRWNPLEGPPPKYDGTWDACYVHVRDYQTIYAGYRYLDETEHDFRSVIIDPLAEVQSRLIDAVSGTDTPTLPQWGTIGRNMEDIIKRFRDLIEHPRYPVEVVLFIALPDERDTKKTTPYIKGSIEKTLPAFVDIVGYLSVEADGVTRRMQIGPGNNVIAKDRTGILLETYGTVITDADSLNISVWLDILNNEINGGNE